MLHGRAGGSWVIQKRIGRLRSPITKDEVIRKNNSFTFQQNLCCSECYASGLPNIAR
jgi:hypothetical protein